MGQGAPGCAGAAGRRLPSLLDPTAAQEGLRGSAVTWLLLSPGNLWFRGGITPSYPQGSSWEHVSNNVRRVSVGPLDQVGRAGGCLGSRPPSLASRSHPRRAHGHWAGLQRACVPGLGHRQQSPGEPQPEPRNRVSSHRRAAPRAQGAGLGLRHRGECGHVAVHPPEAEPPELGSPAGT